MYSGDVQDCGTVYVREKGELRCVNAAHSSSSSSRSGYKAHKLPDRSLWLRLDVEPWERRSDHFIFTYNAAGNLRYSAKTLFDISLLFIAQNIQHVESLVGFPEQMADKLFAAAEEKQKFADPATSAQALRVFSQAYGELVLESLCLRDRCLLLSERMEEIQVFHHLECLDLYGCRLGDNHDIFTHLTSDAFARLMRLFLGNNHLSDKGLQRLTAPVRIMKKGLENLQQLDLSCNPLTEKGLGYLTCFKKLRELDISQIDVKLDVSLRGFLRQKMGMVLSATPLKIFSHSECRTQGWAEEVINQWEIKASELPKKEPKPKSTALRFYGREKFVREQLLSSCNDHKSEEKTPVVHFHKPDPRNNSRTEDHDIENRIKISTQSGKKRNFSTDREEKVEGPPAKRQSVSDFSSEDLDLLNSY